ncbi:TrmB family transcriptional regulator sugar-binding domain-containing protein [uncultured Clostridium sp.]|uniref:TrmB family transcriptional regulator sugar-binding domain-containing protein n=1 Tax=uncultured Clostridium sp. TaxID=59620 RepID=UPI0025E875BA|nr:TrmB family transcriptional regulator sugar-binding domain-containing protein [uncultured Clostridium sp.]
MESYLEGYEDMIKKAKELILSAEKEIYISTNIDLETFQDEFMEASQRGVRITVVSLSEYKGEDLQVDKLYTYIDERDKRKNSKIMMTVDGCKALVADENVNGDGILDVITDNVLLASVVDKNIKNYIYLLKLRDNIAFKLKDN